MFEFYIFLQQWSLKSLEHQGIESAYIKLLRNTCSTATSVICASRKYKK